MIPIATIYSLEMSANGSPWCRTAPNAAQATDVDALTYSADGSPWWGLTSAASTHIKSWNELLYANMKFFDELLMGNVKSINELE